MRKLKALGLVVASLATMATTSSLANGAPQPDLLVGGTCAGSWVTVTGFATVRAEPNTTSRALFSVVTGEPRTCRKIVTGQVYDACGVYDANGWILIQDFNNEYGEGPGWSGYIPSVCTRDGV
ncbi:hypothetical protein AB0I91_12740 [Actinosynnema sp. NPDC049800]